MVRLQKLNRMKIFISLILLTLICISCNQKSEIHITEVKHFYFQNCTNCHSARSSINGATSIEDFNKMDSIYLKAKLQDLKKIKGHYQLFDKLDYSSDDAKIIYDYIKNYFGVRN